MRNNHRIAKLLVNLVLCVFLLTATLVRFVGSSSGSVFLLEMPEEYIDYTVCMIDGSLWAKVDGTYPINKTSLEQKQAEIDDNLFTFSGGSLAMVYPTPPNTRNITIKVDDKELDWSNYTETVPDAVHYTTIGNWPMIICEIPHVPDQFLLKIHYEHPITQKDDGYVFLYDINISPYLSPWSNKSTAHFTMKFETDVIDLKVTTVATDGTTKPVDYTVTKEGTTQTMTLQVTSEYAKLLPGDLLISFKENKETTQTHLYVITVVIAVGAIMLTTYIVMKHKKIVKKNPS